MSSKVLDRDGRVRGRVAITWRQRWGARAVSRRLVGLVLATAVIGYPAASAAHATASSERIVFSVPLPQGGTDTYAINPDGTGLSQVVTPLPNEDLGRAVWSHDGRHLLYSNVPYTDPATGSFVGFLPAISDPDGGSYRLLFTPFVGTDSYCTAWTPDDARIVCGIGENGETPGVYSFRASDGGDPQQLTSNPFGVQENPVGFSPDGTHLAFLRFMPGQADDHGRHEHTKVALFVANADGSNARQVVPYGLLEAGDLTSAAWSPDGHHIATSTPDGRLAIVDVTTGAIQQLPLHPGFTKGYFAYAPTYSPDGNRLVFSMRQNGSFADLYVVGTDGSDLTQITNTPDQPERFPDWGEPVS